jgi:hypothetical protein
MADRTRPGYCAPHFLRSRRRNVPADTIYEGTSMCWDCLDRILVHVKMELHESAPSSP